MATKKPRLTTALLREICAFIQNGAFEKVACEAAGVSYEVFKDWLAQSQKKNASKMLRLLNEKVKCARALARLKPEIAMRSHNPRLWLLQGPGKESPGCPGWSAPPKASGNEKSIEEISPEMLELILAIYQALKPFPDALVALAPVVSRFFPEIPSTVHKKA